MVGVPLVPRTNSSPIFWSCEMLCANKAWFWDSWDSLCHCVCISSPKSMYYFGKHCWSHSSMLGLEMANQGPMHVDDRMSESISLELGMPSWWIKEQQSHQCWVNAHTCLLFLEVCEKCCLHYISDHLSPLGVPSDMQSNAEEVIIKDPDETDPHWFGRVARLVHHLVFTVKAVPSLQILKPDFELLTLVQ